MGKPIELEQTFDVWYHKNFGPEVVTVSRGFLLAAYLAGARDMAQDTLDTLGDYGTAMCGVEAPLRNPTECFDAAHANLMVYYTRVLDDNKN